MEMIFNHPWELGVSLAIILSLVLELGRRVAIAYHIEEAPARKEQMGTIRDGMFVLVSLLLGFTLTLAAARFAERRTLLIEEAISIGTTYLRAGTLPQPYQDNAKRLLREYVDVRRSNSTMRVPIWLALTMPPAVPRRFRTSSGWMRRRLRKTTAPRSRPFMLIR